MKKESDVKMLVLRQLEFDSEIFIPATVVENAEVDATFREIIDGWVVTLNSFVWSEGVSEEAHLVMFKRPASWWQHFKETFFPSLLTHFFPVRYKTEGREVRIERKAVFPKLAVVAGLKEGDDFVVRTEVTEKVYQ
jgi:hypothetical protein